jgi:methylated-DNA-[protein]-cysteine S-methyltransferase
MTTSPSTQSIVRTAYRSPLGWMTLAASPEGLRGVWFDGQKHQPDVEPWPVDAQHLILMSAAAQLGEYFAGNRQTFDLELDLTAGTSFQQSVWRALLAIPAGSTSAYGALSQSIGKPAAVRAVAAAIGRNPLSIVVPCHRVIGSQGSLTGYAGGLERKAALLKLEGALLRQAA